MPPAGIPARLRAAWRSLPGEQRLAAAASAGLAVTLFLPWYQLTVRGRSGLYTTTLSAFQDFSWVEAAVLVVAVAVLALLFARAERRAFHLPGGDGTVVLGAGGWATALLLWRAFDKPGGNGIGAVGLDWGFLFAFAAAGTLAYAGFRIRALGRPEPTRPDPPVRAPAPAPAPVPTPPTSATQALPRATEPLTSATRALPRRPAARPREAEQLPLTAAHGSEEPLPRDDLTLDLGDERD